MLIIIAAFAYVLAAAGLTHGAEAGRKTIATEGSAKQIQSSGMSAEQALGRLDEPYIHDGMKKGKHEYCGGRVEITNKLQDDGTIILKCKVCGKMWREKVAELIK